MEENPFKGICMQRNGKKEQDTLSGVPLSGECREGEPEGAHVPKKSRLVRKSLDADMVCVCVCVCVCVLDVHMSYLQCAI